MLPKNTLGRQMLSKLQVYAGPNHPHAAQKPEPLRPATTAAPADHAHQEGRHTRNAHTTRPPNHRTPQAGRSRVRFRPGQGAITINKVPFEKYFASATHRMLVTEPLRVTNTAESYDIDATIDGGGPFGQAGAVRLGIARASSRSTRTSGCCQAAGSSDARRAGEGAKKYGLKKARKAPQFSKR